MARKRRRKSARSRARKGRTLLTAACALAAVAVIAVGQAGLDTLGRAILPDRAATTAAIPSPKAAERLSTPARMAAPAARPATRPSGTRTRLDTVEQPRPQRAVPAETATPAAHARIPRPPAGVPGGKTAAATGAGLVPLRKPQSGDCACPYDLMLNGSACGARSTYLTPGREKPACYR